MLIGVAVDFGATFDKDASCFKVSDVGSMVQRCPTVRVDIVDVSVAVFDDCLERISLLFFMRTEHRLVDWSFTKDAHSVIDLVTAIDQISQVLRIGLRGGLIQILNHVSGILVLADLEGVGREGS